MPAQSFALTKIQAPRLRSGLVARADLESRMAEAVRTRRLTLVAAPAGFGKTAALTRLIGGLAGELAVAWVAVDSDDDPLGLLACLCAALEPLDPPWRTDPESLVAMAGGSRADRRTVVSELINVLAACEVERALIVVDDAHRIRDPAVFDFLDQLLERLPPQWGVVIATRVDPPLALARLRAHDELAEFRERDLRFGLDEVRALLPALPERIDADATSRRLYERTHGWAVGLRLAVNGLRAGQGTRSAVDDTATDRHVFDYLLAEVLDAMPPDLRAFLLRSSVLPELTAARCAAVTGDARAAVWLEEIERRGLFVSVLEGAENTLRLHDLFRDFLADRLRRELGPELPELHRRAAAGEADTLRRIGYFVRGSAWVDAEAVIADAGSTLVAALGPAPLLRLIEQFPAEVQARSGVLAQMRCYCAWARWDWPAMNDWARRAQSAFAATGDAAGSTRAVLYEALSLVSQGGADAALARAESLPDEGLSLGDRALARLVRSHGTYDRGDLDAHAGRYGEVLDVLEHSSHPPLWYQCVPRTLQCGLPAMGPQLARFATGALRVTGEAPTPLRAFAHAARAWGRISAGDLDDAAAALQLAEADARWLGPPANVRVFVYGALAMLRGIQGRRDDAVRAIDEMMKTFDDPDVGYPPGSVFHAYHALHAARVADLVGDAAELERRAHGLLPARGDDDASPVLRAQRRATEARLASSRGDDEAAAARWRQALGDEVALGVFGQAREAWLRLGLAELRQGRLDAAAAAVERALDGAAAEGEPGGALAAGTTVLAALASAPWDGRLRRGGVDTLRGWAARLGAPAAGEGGASAPAADPRTATGDALLLSPRELEVLRQIAAGDSNKLIARAFDLSPHTVKRHVANILDKLGLQSRGQAAAWYRDHA